MKTCFNLIFDSLKRTNPESCADYYASLLRITMKVVEMATSSEIEHLQKWQEIIEKGTKHAADQLKCKVVDRFLRPSDTNDCLKVRHNIPMKVF